jgi:hypothetical protein
MKARIRFAGINGPKDANRLSQMINEAENKMQQGPTDEKGAFLQMVEKEEAKFLVEGFERA